VPTCAIIYVAATIAILEYSLFHKFDSIDCIAIYKSNANTQEWRYTYS